VFPAGGQHHEAAGQGQVGGQGRALGFRGLLLHLDQEGLALLEEFSDIQAGFRRPGGLVEIFGMDVPELEKTVAVAGIADESRLQAGLDVLDDALVDVAQAQFPEAGIGIILLEVAIGVQHGHPAFFGVHGVDENFHENSLVAAPGAFETF